MKIKEPNALDILQARRVKFCPPHFATTNFPKRYNLERVICDWIETNLVGRYFYGSNIDLYTSKENEIVSVSTVGFESQKELSFFLLACPHLKYN